MLSNHHANLPTLNYQEDFVYWGFRVVSRLRAVCHSDPLRQDPNDPDDWNHSVQNSALLVDIIAGTLGPNVVDKIVEEWVLDSWEDGQDFHDKIHAMTVRGLWGRVAEISKLLPSKTAPGLSEGRGRKMHVCAACEARGAEEVLEEQEKVDFFKASYLPDHGENSR